MGGCYELDGQDLDDWIYHLEQAWLAQAEAEAEYAASMMDIDEAQAP
jgi:hypothetical protein